MLINSSTDKKLIIRLVILGASYFVIHYIIIILDSVISDLILKNLILGCLWALISFSIGVLIVVGGLNVSRNKQIPLPKIWAVEASKMIRGRKATVIGKCTVFLGFIKLLFSLGILYVSIEIYLSST